jgi:DNA-binding XRE family transcriptional regulator
MLRSPMALLPETSCQPPPRRPSALELVRRSQRLSREGLAAAAGVSARTIYNIEVAGRNPRRATKRVLCLALGCRPEDLFPAPNAASPAVIPKLVQRADSSSRRGRASR